MVSQFLTFQSVYLSSLYIYSTSRRYLVYLFLTLVIAPRIKQDLKLLQVLFFILRLNKWTMFPSWLPFFSVQIRNVFSPIIVLSYMVLSALLRCELKFSIRIMDFWKLRFRISCVNGLNNRSIQPSILKCKNWKLQYELWAIHKLWWSLYLWVSRNYV